MRLRDAAPRHPALEPVSEELRRVKWLWCVCCLSPVLYLAIARFLKAVYFIPGEREGLTRLPPGQYEIAAISFLVVTLSLQVALLVVRNRFRARMCEPAAGLVRLMQLYRKRTIFLLAVSDTAGLLGFVLFLLRGDLRAVLVGGVLALAYYAQSYPSERGLAAYAKDL
jgi:hypothetical protein